LADGYHSLQILGGKPGSVAASGRDRPPVSSSLDSYATVRGGLTAQSVLRRTASWGTQWGQTDGLRLTPPSNSLSSAVRVGGRAACGRPYLASYSARHSLLGPARAFPSRGRSGGQDSYLVDSASSHMLVSKIKPCMSKYKHLYRETANGSLNQLSFI
jgi:hypothetical protein